jgi:hypothetical protein
MAQRPRARPRPRPRPHRAAHPQRRSRSATSGSRTPPRSPRPALPGSPTSCVGTGRSRTACTTSAT